MTTVTIQPTQTSEQQAEAILELTRALEQVIQKLEITPPSDIAIFFGGTEIYRYQSTDDNIFWWGNTSN